MVADKHAAAVAVGDMRVRIRPRSVPDCAVLQCCIVGSLAVGVDALEAVAVAGRGDSQVLRPAVPGQAHLHSGPCRRSYASS